MDRDGYDRILCTVNIGGTFIAPNVMQSHMSAASRWGAQYLQLTSPWVQTDQLWLLKAKLGNAGFGDNTRVCYIDGDAIIRHDCPDPFDMVAPDSFGGAAGFQYSDIDTSEAKTIWDKMNAVFRMAVPFDPDTYMNGGFLVFTTRLHRKVWDYERAWMFATRAIGPMVEQTLLSYSLAAQGIGITLLSDSMNRIGPEAWASGPMSHYVQHLAGGPWSEGIDRDEAIAMIDWTATADKGVRVGA